jgi:hypothetical protein
MTPGRSSKGCTAMSFLLGRFTRRPFAKKNNATPFPVKVRSARAQPLLRRSAIADMVRAVRMVAKKARIRAWNLSSRPLFQ